jgi:hypothetical protein
MEFFQDKKFREALSDDSVRRRLTLSLCRYRAVSFWLSVLVGLFAAFIFVLVPPIRLTVLPLLAMVAFMGWTLSLKYELELRLLALAESVQRRDEGAS